MYVWLGLGLSKGRVWFWIFLGAQYSETDRRYAFVLVICRPFRRQNRGHNSLWGAGSVAEITWRPAGALQTLVGFTLNNCKKVDKTITAFD